MEMKRILMLTVILFSSVAAFADTVTFGNSDGSLVSNTARTTLTLSNSLLTGISGLAGFGVPDQSLTLSLCRATGCFGKVAFTTGTKASGFLFSPTATFNSGGSITVTGSNFTFGGSFVGGTTWTCTPAPLAGCNSTGGTWSFFGTVTGGMLTINGHTYMIPTAATVQLTTSGTAPTGGTGQALTWTDAGGTTTFAAPVAEPSSLGLVGSGLVALGALAKQRNSRKDASL
jgi:hypothetical protein